MSTMGTMPPAMDPMGMQAMAGAPGVISTTDRAFSKTIRAARKARMGHEDLWNRWRMRLGGYWYPDKSGGRNRMRAENMEYMYLWRVLQDVAARMPHISVRARRQFTDAYMAKLHEVAVNAILDRQGFFEELRKAIHDSLWGFGCIKTGLHPAHGGGYGDTMAGELGLLDGSAGSFDPTMPFAQRVSPYAMLWDDAAECWDATEFLGHEFMRSLDAAIEDDRYDIGARMMFRDQTSLLTEDERQRRYGHIEQLGPMVRMVELWVRQTNELWTLYEQGPEDFVVCRKVPFHGPASGPYAMLGYMNVPDRVLPFAPYAGWHDMHREHELTLKHLMDQASAYKRLGVVRGHGGKVDGQNIQKAGDDTFLVVDEDTNVDSLEMGGVSDQVINWATLTQAKSERMSGMTDQRMGVAGAGNTATESSIVAQNAGSSIQEMRRRVAGLLEKVADGVGYYVHNDPTVSLTATVEGEDGEQADVAIYGGMDVDPWTGQVVDAQPQWEDFYARVNPDDLYTSADQLDKAQAREQAEFMLTVLDPALAQQGMTINKLSFARDMSEKMGMRSVENWIVPMTPAAMLMAQQSMMSEPGGQEIRGAMTTRTPGADPIQSQIMNGGANPSISGATQAASPMREAMTPAGSNNTPRGM